MSNGEKENSGMEMVFSGLEERQEVRKAGRKESVKARKERRKRKCQVLRNGSRTNVSSE